MEEKKTFLRQWLEAQEKRKAATAAMEAYIAETAAEEEKEEDETECLTPMEEWWQECVKLDKQFKESKRDYLERFEEAYWNQVENERKAKEYTKYGLDNWLEILELGIKERMEEEPEVWCTNHRKRMLATAKELRAKKRRIDGINVNPQDPSDKN